MRDVSVTVSWHQKRAMFYKHAPQSEEMYRPVKMNSGLLITRGILPVAVTGITRHSMNYSRGLNIAVSKSDGTGDLGRVHIYIYFSLRNLSAFIPRRIQFVFCSHRLIHNVLRSHTCTYNFNPHWFHPSIHLSIHTIRSWRSSSLGHRFWSQCIVYFHYFRLSAWKYKFVFTLFDAHSMPHYITCTSFFLAFFLFTCLRTSMHKYAPDPGINHSVNTPLDNSLTTTLTFRKIVVMDQ